jgi:hypothetical protein
MPPIRICGRGVSRWTWRSARTAATGVIITRSKRLAALHACIGTVNFMIVPIGWEMKQHERKGVVENE